MSRITIILIVIALAAFAYFALRGASGQDAGKADAHNAVVETVTLKKTSLEKNLRLPGDLLPYEVVDIYAKVSGFIDTLPVDRGSEVNKNEVLARMTVPELDKTIEAFEAQYRTAQDIYERNKQTGIPIISPAAMQASKNAADAAHGNLGVLQEQRNYLTVRAPFDGVITTRNLHPGALVIAGGSAGAVPIVRLENIQKLRLVVAVPEAQAERVKEGIGVTFTVTAIPGRTFTAKVARISHSLEQRTRTQPVEMDVDNSDRALAPGMYADVQWPTIRSSAGFVVPSKTIATTTERIFVIRVKDGVTEWVDIQRSDSSGDMVEIVGDLQEGDTLVARANDELKEGVKVDVQNAPPVRLSNL